jgi:Fe-S cluster assembly protein SufD
MASTANEYLDSCEAAAVPRPGEPTTLTELRSRGRDRFGEVGFPSVKEEEWRYTNVAPLARRGFRPVSGQGAVTAERVEELSYEGCDRLVFVDGQLAPQHTRIGELPEHTWVGSLSEALQAGVHPVPDHVGRHASLEKGAFVALNTALFEDGVAIVVPRGAVLERPIQVIHLASSEAEGRAIYTRNLFVASELSQATVIESYCGDASDYFHCVVSEHVGEASSHFDHYKLQRESQAAFHIATQQTWLGRSAVFRSHNISLGGGLVRSDINAILDGEGVHCTLDGLYVATDEQLVDTQMRVEHAKPHCDSHELYKGILDGRARAVFNGRIYVHEDAQKTDAKQTNRNLLLSPDALVNSNPQLEIFADDVRCTHGSTVGQLDDDAIFYLRSRGIGEQAARSLLTFAFAGEVAEGIRVDAVRDELEEFLFGRLASGEVVRQAI